MQLDTFPASLATCEKLTRLALACNKIEELPRGFGNFPNLRYLDLSNNKLTTISSQLGYLGACDLGRRRDSLQPGQRVWLVGWIVGLVCAIWVVLCNGRAPNTLRSWSVCLVSEIDGPNIDLFIYLESPSPHAPFFRHEFRHADRVALVGQPEYVV